MSSEAKDGPGNADDSQADCLVQQNQPLDLEVGRVHRMLPALTTSSEDGMTSQN